jgi:hypothetical protein
LLIEANRYHQIKTRYETFDELLDYCALSSQPLGRIVLRLFDATAPHRMSLRTVRCPNLLSGFLSGVRTYRSGQRWLHDDDRVSLCWRDGPEKLGWRSSGCAVFLAGEQAGDSW